MMKPLLMVLSYSSRLRRQIATTSSQSNRRDLRNQVTRPRNLLNRLICGVKFRGRLRG